MPRRDPPDPHEDPTLRVSGSRRATPTPLEVAAGLTGVQGVVTVLLALAELVSLDADRLLMGGTTAAFFMAYGVLLVVAAWGLHAVRGWARAPVLLAQLIWLGLAWNFRSPPTTAVSAVLVIVAVIVLVGLLHPRSTDALTAEGAR